MKEIKIKTEYIKLDSLLKYADVAGSGGEAKFLIKSGLVNLNGQTATERGKKIRQNDIIEVYDEDGKVVEKIVIV